MENLPVHLAGLTYLSPNHLERYENLESYYETKWKLFEKCQGSCFANRLGGDTQNFVNQKIKKNPALKEKIIFTDPSHAGLNADQWTSSQLVGKHNEQNIALAWAISQQAEWPKFCLQGILDYKGLPHRLENCGLYSGIHVINDSKATTIDSVLSAIDSIKDLKSSHQIIVLLGGRDKKLPWEKLSILKNQANLTLVFFGECASHAQQLSQLDGRCFPKLSPAISYALELCQNGDKLLLSPGGSSLDEFKNFEERGSFFKKIVQEHFASQKKEIL
jgi:UDP-N-acetylmuramoylalanine--D-glutamate ligase